MQKPHLFRQSAGLLYLLMTGLAYLDPGTGSYIISIVIATLLGGLFMLRTQLRQFFDSTKQLFSKNKVDTESPAADPTDDSHASDE